MSALRSDHKVLVVAADPLLAGMIGALVETTGIQAAFPDAGERTEEALTRVKPLAAILMDSQVAESDSDLFLARARRKRVPVFVFGSAAAITARRRWAEERNVAVFALPEDIDSLQEVLQTVGLPTRGDARRMHERRAAVTKLANGTIIFSDASGTRWSVYDRRAGDRRNEEIDRRFVSDGGEVRHCLIDRAHAVSLSATDLAEQLARSTPVA